MHEDGDRSPVKEGACIEPRPGRGALGVVPECLAIPENIGNHGLIGLERAVPVKGSTCRKKSLI